MKDQDTSGCGIEITASSPRGQINWWLLLIFPASMEIAILVSILNPETFPYLKAPLEAPAPYLAGLVALVYAARSLVTRNPLYIVLTALAAAFTLREIHFGWTHKGIYVMLVCIGIWAGLWRGRLRGPLRDWRHTSWLIATFAAYFLSQVIARRAFRFIPGEDAIHIPLEEWAETTAHHLFLITSLVGSWRRMPASPGRAKS